MLNQWDFSVWRGALPAIESCWCAVMRLLGLWGRCILGVGAEDNIFRVPLSIRLTWFSIKNLSLFDARLLSRRVLVELVPEPGQRQKALMARPSVPLWICACPRTWRVRQKSAFAEIRHQHLGAIGCNSSRFLSICWPAERVERQQTRATEALPSLAEPPSALRPTQLSVKLIHGYRKVILRAAGGAGKNPQIGFRKITLAINDSGIPGSGLTSIWPANICRPRPLDCGKSQPEGGGPAPVSWSRMERVRVSESVMKVDESSWKCWKRTFLRIGSPSTWRYGRGEWAWPWSGDHRGNSLWSNRPSFWCTKLPHGAGHYHKTLSAAFHSIELPSSSAGVGFSNPWAKCSVWVAGSVCRDGDGAERFGIKVPQKLTGEVARPVRSVQEPVLAPGDRKVLYRGVHPIQRDRQEARLPVTRLCRLFRP